MLCKKANKIADTFAEVETLEPPTPAFGAL
jgi:hypothetical protein